MVNNEVTILLAKPCLIHLESTSGFIANNTNI